MERSWSKRRSQGKPGKPRKESGNEELLREAESEGDMKHTPGPWRVGDRQSDNHAVNVLDTRGFLTAQARAAGGGWAEAKTNARLIAAAPEMLEALRELTEAASVMFCNLASLNERDRQLAADCYWDSTEKARAALEKAGAT